MSWHELRSEEEFNRLLEDQSQSFAIFKHSSRCGVSSWVRRSFNSDWKSDYSQVDIYEVDVIRNRAISQLIAEKLNIHHESPQLIVVKNGEVIHNESHNNIEAKSLVSIQS